MDLGHGFFYFREQGYLEELKNALFAEMRESDTMYHPEELKGAARQLFCTYTDEIGPEDETEEKRDERQRSIGASWNLRRDIAQHEITQSSAHRPVKYAADCRAVAKAWSRRKG